MNEYVEEIKQKLLKRYGSIPDRCFILGNGPSLNNMDLSYLTNEITIACNSFMEGMDEKGGYFLPSILCCGDGSLLKEFIRKDFQFDTKGTYDKIKKDLIYIFHPGALVRNCYDIRNWTTLCPHHTINKVSATGCECIFTKPVDMDHFDTIMKDSNNFYLIEDFETFKLNKDINALMYTKETANQILHNYTYCYRFSNVIPMIACLIAQELGMKYIYLIGCDGQKFDVHFYDKFTGRSSIDTQSKEFKDRYYGGVYKGMLDRSEIIKGKNIKMYTCFESVYTFIPFYSFNDYIANFGATKQLSDNDKQILVDRYHHYVNKSDPPFIAYDHYKDICERRIQKYNDTTKCVIFGKSTDFTEIDYNKFYDNMTIVMDGLIDRLLLKYNDRKPFICYITEPCLIKELPNLFNMPHFKNHSEIMFILNLFECINNITDDVFYLNLQQFVSAHDNVVLLANLETLELNKSIHQLRDPNMHTHNTKIYQTFNELELILKLVEKIGLYDIYLYGFNNNMLHIDINKYKWANLTNLDKKFHTDNIIDIDLIKLNKKTEINILEKVTNYKRVLKLKNNKENSIRFEETSIILEALEALITGKNDSAFHDFLYIKNKIN